MKFPSNLQPKWYYKFINELEPYWIFQRATLQKIEKEESRLIKPEIIASPSKHLLNYSVNLLGEYIDDYKYVSLTKKGKILFDLKWKEFGFTFKPKHPKHFELDYEKGALYFLVKDICETNYDLTYKATDFKVEPIIKHDPMHWNFWHFEISWDVTPKEHIPTSSNGRKEFDKAIVHNIRTIFQNFGNYSHNIEYTLMESIYKKDSRFILFLRNCFKILKNSDIYLKFRLIMSNKSTYFFFWSFYFYNE